MVKKHKGEKGNSGTPQRAEVYEYSKKVSPVRDRLLFFFLGFFVAIFVLILAAVIKVTFFGSEKDAGNDVQSDETAQQEDGYPFKVTLLSSEKVTLNDIGAMGDYIAINLQFTNNSDSTQSFASACSWEAYQNGAMLDEGCNYTTITQDEGERILPGYSTNVRIYALLKDSSPVTLQVKETFFGDAVLLDVQIPLT